MFYFRVLGSCTCQYCGDCDRKFNSNWFDYADSSMSKIILAWTPFFSWYLGKSWVLKYQDTKHRNFEFTVGLASVLTIVHSIFLISKWRCNFPSEQCRFALFTEISTPQPVFCVVHFGTLAENLLHSSAGPWWVFQCHNHLQVIFKSKLILNKRLIDDTDKLFSH